LMPPTVPVVDCAPELVEPDLPPDPVELSKMTFPPHPTEEKAVTQSIADTALNAVGPSVR
jgi:hypothetical protein